MTDKNFFFQWLYKAVFLGCAMVGFSSCAKLPHTIDFNGYLFVYFTGNGPGQEAIHYAVSQDGFHFRALNRNRPVLDSKKISSSGGLRDPHILRGQDGKTFYMVATDLYVPRQGWHNHAMVLMKSTDLIHWKSSVVNIPKRFPLKFGNVNRVWAPQTIFDPSVGKYMVYFSMKQNDAPDIIYYAYANDDFSGLATKPRQLFFSPTNNACIDADIIAYNHGYSLFFKSEDGDPGIKLAVSDSLTSGYKMVTSKRIDAETSPVEGSGVFLLNHSNQWILMYDRYMQGSYQFTISNDLRHFKVIDKEMSMNFHPRHGTVMPITTAELRSLIVQWGVVDDPLIRIHSKAVYSRNIAVDTVKHTIHIPVADTTTIRHFNPDIDSLPGFEVTPSGPQNFSTGPVTYTFAIEGKKSLDYHVEVSKDHNPVLHGYYADPEVMYAHQTGKYYIYPTTDGFDNWSGYYFKAFSSTNLVDWKDEGIILNLKKDVSWADGNAWAPCIEEKKENGHYRYFFYFTAARKIGVAIADSPTGPFHAVDHPLVAAKPQGIKGGQEIDPDVFTDPVSKKSYLYWGNGYMAGAQLNGDMISLKKGSLKILTPDRTFREGTYVFYRKGTYYFLWSDGDTRSPNYKVRYATARSPLGKLRIPGKNIVIQKNPDNEIYATGHCSVLQIPGKDKWYLVYHRFTCPKGILMGQSAGFHREVCIDKLNFDAKGAIQEVIPTLKGVDKLEK